MKASVLVTLFALCQARLCLRAFPGLETFQRMFFVVILFSACVHYVGSRKP